MGRLTGTVLATALAMAILGGCTPPVPDSAEGVGFQDYSSYDLRQAQRQAAAQAVAPAPRISDEVVAGAPPVGVSTLPPPGTAVPGAPMPTVASTLPPAAPAPGTPLPPATASQIAAAADAAPPADPAQPTGMSDEQDFAAVSARETIQSDAERLAQARAAYQQVQPVALPEREGASDTIVIDYALATSNAVGQRLYDRGGKVSQDRFFRACAKYGSQDIAQEEFLRAGGPERDSRYVDPDGDGFACFWDPAPFRNARLGAVAAPVAREVQPGGG
jgi:hypothetical protein